MMDFKALIFDVTEGVATITLNRPEVFNAIDVTLATELHSAALACDDDPAIRCVLFLGSGRAFCAGGDLKSFASQGTDTARHLKEVTTFLHAAISRLVRSNKPVVAGVHGAAAGAGFSLALACDLVVAAQSARFTLAYTKAGLTPDGSSTYFLPRIVGMRRALELTYTNRVLSAADAESWGIVSRVVADDALVGEAKSLATELAAGPTLAFGRSKDLLRRTWNETLESQMENETQAISASARTADYAEGSAAFFEKRSPHFSGR
jgi:2-(1,2-epoxy-1,2-dihydrophenyl)acetyl-CoA isomerase